MFYDLLTERSDTQHEAAGPGKKEAWVELLVKAVRRGAGGRGLGRKEDAQKGVRYVGSKRGIWSGWSLLGVENDERVENPVLTLYLHVFSSLEVLLQAPLLAQHGPSSPTMRPCLKGPACWHFVQACSAASEDLRAAPDLCCLPALPARRTATRRAASAWSGFGISGTPSSGLRPCACVCTQRGSNMSTHALRKGV